MEIEWTKTERLRLEDATEEQEVPWWIIKGVATRAVELVQARGVRGRGSWSEDLALVVDGVTRDLRLAAAQRLSHDLVAQGTTVATLQAKVAEWETWNAARSDFEALGSALATRGAELPECKTAGGIVIKSTVRDLRAEVERLMEGRDAANANAANLQAYARSIAGAVVATVGGHVAGEPTNALNYLQRLRALVAAESRLAAIREKLADAAIDAWMDEPHDPEPLSDDALLRAFARWLEGAALNSPGILDGSGGAPQEAKESAQGQLFCSGCLMPQPHAWTPRGTESARWRCTVCGLTSNAGRYPCSPTCIHPDASTPGHPERVKERSDAFNAAGICAVEQCERHSAYDMGIEAMRAACLEAVDALFVNQGLLNLRAALKAAIEGAAP